MDPLVVELVKGRRFFEAAKAVLKKTRTLCKVHLGPLPLLAAVLWAVAVIGAVGVVKVHGSSGLVTWRHWRLPLGLLAFGPLGFMLVNRLFGLLFTGPGFFWRLGQSILIGTAIWVPAGLCILAMWNESAIPAVRWKEALNTVKDTVKDKGAMVVSWGKEEFSEWTGLGRDAESPPWPEEPDPPEEKMSPEEVKALWDSL